MSLCVSVPWTLSSLMFQVKLTFMLTEIRSFWFDCLFACCVFVTRTPRDLACFGKRQIRTRTCIAWPWLVQALTVTSSVSTLCPNTLVSTRHFLKRLEHHLNSFLIHTLHLSYIAWRPVLICHFFHTKCNVFDSRCFQSPGSCPPARLHSSSSI